MRRTLPPPVGDSKGTGEESIPLSYNAANRCLEISFETPFRNQPGHDGMLQREPKRHLTAEIRVYRRFIRGEIDGLSPDPAPLKSLSADPDVIALDRWQEAQGFSFFRSQDLCPPAVGDLWQTVITTPGNRSEEHTSELQSLMRNS